MSKILFVHDGPIYVYNESSYFAYSYDNQIKKRYLKLGETITFMMRAVSIDEKKYTEINSENMSVEAIPDFKNPKLYLKNIMKARRKIKETVQSHDLIIIRLPSSIGSIAVKYAKKFDKPYLIELVGCPLDAYWNHSLTGKLIAPFEYLKTKRQVKDAEYTLYVTNDFLQKRYPTKGRALGCSDVNVSIEGSISAKRENKISQAVKNKKIVIGTMGNVDLLYKGQKYVIEALSNVDDDSNFEFEYQLIGSGDPTNLKKIAEKLGVQKQIKFIGTLNKEEVFNWLDNVDIYIQPSMLEGLPRAVVEAMSRGCLVSGSKVGGIYELVSEEFLFKSKNSNQITQILQSITIQKLLSESKRSLEVASQFEYEIIEQKRWDFYKEFQQKERKKQ